MAQRAAIYCRISEDANLTGLGVERQESDCRKLAEAKSWPVAHVFIENDTSATSGKLRPVYQAMLAAVRAGEYDAVVVWDVDRLTRTPSELESFIDLANAMSLSLASVGGEIDLATPQGRLTARIKGAVARHEVEQSSRRLKAKNRQRAEAGLPHGTEAWGWTRKPLLDDAGRQVGTYDELDPAKALLIQEAAARVIAGDALLRIATDWNERGLVRANGRPWNRTAMRDMLLRERNAGLRQYQGEVIGKGAWEPALDRETWERVCAVLRDPSRRNRPGPQVPSLLAGIARCGICGTPMGSVLRGRQGRPGLRSLVCPRQQCQGVVRKEIDVQTYVEGLVIPRLASESASELFARKGSDPELARQRVDVLRERKNDAAVMFAAGEIDGAQLRAVNARLDPELKEAEVAYLETLAEPDLMDLTGLDVAARWADEKLMPIERKRRVVSYLLEITLRPTSHTGYYRRVFDPTTVLVEWKV